MQARLVPEDQEDEIRIKEMGLQDPRQLLLMKDLVRGDDVIFAATGITDGDLLQGVRYFGRKATTHSIVMRGKTGTVRLVQATHMLDKKPQYVARIAPCAKETNSPNG